MTRCGLFGARADRRGLAALSENIWRNMAPAKTLVIDMARHRPFKAEPERFPGADVMTYDAVLRCQDWRPWLDGLDVVLTLETPYTFDIYTQAAAVGVKTILLAMPEYLPYYRGGHLPRPDVIALPTNWLVDRHPDAVLLPVPVEPFDVEAGDWVLHPAGGPAAQDRNGTRLVLAAAAMAVQPWRWLVRAQEPPDQPWGSARVEVADLPTPAHVLAGAAVVVLPRRYAGLSLVLQDVMAAGLPVLATDAAPYGPELAPESRLAATPGPALQAKGGAIPTWKVAPRTIADAVAAVVGDDEMRASMAKASRTWAEAHTWDVLRPLWDQVLAP